MHVTGPCADGAGRKFVASHPGESAVEIVPPELFGVVRDKELLGRLPYAATADETYGSLIGILAQHPELAPPGGCADPDPEPDEPALVRLRDLETRYDSTTPAGDWWKQSVGLLF